LLPEHPQASAAASTAARYAERRARRGSAEKKPALCLMKPSNDLADLLCDEAELVRMRFFSREDIHELPQPTGKRLGIGRGSVQGDRRGDQIVRQGGRCGQDERQRVRFGAQRGASNGPVSTSIMAPNRPEGNTAIERSSDHSSDPARHSEVLRKTRPGVWGS